MEWLKYFNEDNKDVISSPKQKHPINPIKDNIWDIWDVSEGIKKSNLLDTTAEANSLLPENYKDYLQDGLPTHFFDGGDHSSKYGDRSFITTRLVMFSEPIKSMVAARYSIIYLGAYEACLDEIKRENQARRTANMYLLRQSKQRSKLIE